MEGNPMDRRIIFDAVRAMLGRGFRQDEVAALDRAIDRAAGLSLMAPAAIHPHVGEKGLALIKAWEGCALRRPDGRFEAYPDPGTGGAPWTIGWGSTGSGIGPGTIWTQADCDARLEADLARLASEVHAAIGAAATSQAQFDALVSFHYNTGAIARATLTQRHRAGDFAGARAQFGRWIHAGGRPLAGLRKRRAAEAELYGSG